MQKNVREERLGIKNCNLWKAKLITKNVQNTVIDKLWKINNLIKNVTE